MLCSKLGLPTVAEQADCWRRADTTGHYRDCPTRGKDLRINIVRVNRPIGVRATTK